MAAYPASTSPYTGIFEKPVYLQIGQNISMAPDPATNACALLPDSGLNAGGMNNDADNGVGATSCNGTNPINPAWRGNKIQREFDYRGAGAFPLEFARTYNSRSARVAGLTSGADSAVTGSWTHSYQRSLQLFIPADLTGINTVQSAAVFRPDGRIAIFKPSGSTWVAASAQMPETLTHLGDGTWRYVSPRDDIETYSSAGKLIAIATRSGLTQTLAYDGSGRLATITDPAGRTLTLGYDASSRLTTLTDPNSGITQYAYDGQSRLTTVTYPGGGLRTYHYENASYPKALTGITDENNERTATWTYDSQGRATGSEHGASNSGIDRHTVTYNANGSATITDALGSPRTYTYLDQFSTAKLAGATQPAGAGCAAAAQAIGYDSNGFVSSRTDYNGVQTTSIHNTRGLETSRTEAVGTPQARTITTTWHANYRLPLQIDEPGRRTTFTYDPAGNRLTRTLTDTTTSNSRTWTWTYNAQGQVLTEDGPRTDVLDKTTYTYYSDTTASHRPGDLATVTDALGHLTQITAYDGHGRPLTVIDPNTVTLSFTYTPRGDLASSTVAGQATLYDHDPARQLTAITRPDGSKTTYDYDAAHRLSSVTDLKGNRVTYTLDTQGNVTRTDWLNPNGSTARSQRADYDALGRLNHAIATRNALDYSTSYGYDANGNPKTTTDPKNQTTSTHYDALNRPTQITDALTGLTTLAYDARDQLTQYKAPNNAATTYTVDALGNRTQEVSPDRGTTTATYDGAGNLLTRNDARGLIETHTWDALNRPLSVSYPTSGENVLYTWDTGTGCSNGIGRLCQVSDGGGTTTFAYDARGNLSSQTRNEGGIAYSTQYTYDGADRIATLITPTGKLLTAQRNSDGQLTELATAVGSTPGLKLVSAIAQNAAGQLTAQTWGNGVTEAKAYHTDGSPLSQTDTAPGGGSNDADVPTLPEWAAILMGLVLLTIGYRNQNARRGGGRFLSLVIVALTIGLGVNYSPDAQADEALTYDANGNIVSRTLPGGTTTYGYDALDRITSEAGPAKTQSLTYDGNDNRLTDGTGSKTYTPNTDRIATENGSAITLDAAGNTTAARGYVYTWTQAGQLKTVSQGATLLATYTYDYQGRRTKKVTTASAPQGASTVIYHYDQPGHLLAETTATGSPLVTYVWRDDAPVSIIVAGSGSTPETALYLEVDHLNTPIAARDQQGKVVWTWESDAFGTTLPNEDPDADGKTVTINLRFPGQYYDRESGLHYNWHRYYDPKLGRYLSSDPIGLAGGGNTYSYVEGNPVNDFDPDGLMGSRGNPTLHRPDPAKRAYDTKYCATAECVAGLTPAVPEVRTQKDVEVGQCKLVCGAMWPGPILPLKWASVLPWVGAQVTSYLGCKKICEKDGASCSVQQYRDPLDSIANRVAGLPN